MHVPGEVKVDVLHGQHLGVAAAGRAALYAEHRAQRGLPQGDDSLLPDLRHSLAQARGGGGLPLSGGSGVDGGHQHQFAVGAILQAGKGPLVDLPLVLPVKLQLVFLDAKLGGDIRDGPQRRALGDLDIRKHSFQHLSGQRP